MEVKHRKDELLEKGINVYEHKITDILEGLNGTFSFETFKQFNNGIELVTNCPLKNISDKIKDNCLGHHIGIHPKFEKDNPLVKYAAEKFNGQDLKESFEHKGIYYLNLALHRIICHNVGHIIYKDCLDFFLPYKENILDDGDFRIDYKRKEVGNGILITKIIEQIR